MVSSRYVAAQKVLTYYIEKLEDDNSEEAKWVLQYINIQMAKYKCSNALNILYSYPIDSEDL